MSFAAKLLGFSGRLSRLDWWLFAIGLNVIGVALSAVLMSAFAAPGAQINGSMNAPRDYVALGVAALMLWPSLAITVKRRRDRGSSGWIAAVLFTVLSALNAMPLLYLVLGIVGFEKGGWWGLLGVIVTPLILWLVLLILLGFLPGDPDENRYGPSPLKPAAPAP